ncbi:YkvA family protein [Luteimonas saliphila]|uniref:YkvA family protein n=1 Tax=Luteimonas saliphila TaxID=2804919 RepID=UPI00192D7F0A|nr:YkvA family protein [Luteimonas saliphila]
MSLSLTIDLNDQDLAHFTAALKAAHKAAEHKSADEIIAAAAGLLEGAQKVKTPDFIRERLVRLDDMIAMVRDEGWHLEDEDKQHVLSALVYFADPKDVIPDHVEVLGFLDDAIMIELCVRELKHELDAYDDFCDYREREASKRGIDPATVGRADWLESRRDELVERMHARRSRDGGGEFGMGYGSSSGYGKASYSRAWRPSLFKFR